MRLGVGLPAAHRVGAATAHPISRVAQMHGRLLPVRPGGGDARRHFRSAPARGTQVDAQRDVSIGSLLVAHALSMEGINAMAGPEI